MRILIAEDDPSIAAGVSASLRQGGHAVDCVTDGAKADAALRDTPYDLLILDLGLPNLDGADVLQRLRKRGTGLPVLVITAREGLRERVRVLDLGADDYLVKPFALAEFEARVRALLRRYTSQGAPELTMGRLRLDLPGHRAWIDDQPLELTAREFGLLEALAARPDRVTSRAQLVEALCSWDEELTDNGLDIAIYRLRRKLADSGTQVRTIRGLGYLLEEVKEGKETKP
ncbi:response regulator [Dyella kyungheensis]|jgi:two-component system OmpR family response regulator|uniref:Response regulator n=1 Tax=Dyella kyungheensis TaxID=1242174 RepID=A0ABS2JNS2_9GAMM|nr:response regulator [Dyella kyungheensis]MBM7120681.1 response regulator [Dyella kyungheensis]